MPTTVPTLEPAELKTGRWFAALTRGSGAVEQIGDFATREEAAKWIAQEAKAWLAKHPASEVCATCGGSGQVTEGLAPTTGGKLVPANCENCGGWGRTLS
jgi:hypothetical protein